MNYKLTEPAGPLIITSKLKASGLVLLAKQLLCKFCNVNIWLCTSSPPLQYLFDQRQGKDFQNTFNKFTKDLDKILSSNVGYLKEIC